MKMKALIAVIFVILIIATGCSLLPQEEAVLAPPLVAPAQVNYQLTEVVRGDIVLSLRGVANFSAYKMDDLFFRSASGRLKEVHVRRGDEVKEGDLLVTLDQGNLAYDLRLMEIDLQKARLRFTQQKENETNWYSLEIAKLDLELAEMRYGRLKAQYEATMLHATMDGVVTYVTDRREGEQIGVYQTLIQIADPTQLDLIYTSSNTADLMAVNVGMAVDIEYQGRKYVGKVTQTPRTVPGNLPQDLQNLMRRSIVIKMDELPESVGLGDLANIEIVLQKSENTLLIPRNALRSFMGRDFVQIMENDTLREIDVEKGIVTSTRVEIRSGLTEDTRVVIR
jgi:multidrug efflux pump subunit AcrA (membrane-fusion protein)